MSSVNGSSTERACSTSTAVTDRQWPSRIDQEGSAVNAGLKCFIDVGGQSELCNWVTDRWDVTTDEEARSNKLTDMGDVTNWRRDTM